MYYIVDVIGGVLDIDYLDLIEARVISPSKAVVHLKAEAKPRSRWQEISELEWLAYFGTGIVSVDKITIQANGVDTATVTVVCHPTLENVTFYSPEMSEVVQTVEVDPSNNMATLQITANTPGRIRLRVGERMMLPNNEVEVFAVEADPSTGQ